MCTQEIGFKPKSLKSFVYTNGQDVCMYVCMYAHTHEGCMRGVTPVTLCTSCDMLRIILVEFVRSVIAPPSLTVELKASQPAFVS